jgi:Rnl2 family RNA ligase
VGTCEEKKMVDTSFCQEGSHPFGLGREETNNLKFSKYPSIDNVDRKKTIDYIVQLGLENVLWQGSLKVHGANFCIVTDGEDMKSGKRSGFIVPSDGGFHNYQNVIANYQQQIFDFYKTLKLMFPDYNQLTLCGELFGGMYNHPDVERDPHASRVQKGVEYCPHNDFFLFDIKVDDMFIEKTWITHAIDNFGFVGAKPLFMGTLTECLKQDPHIQDPLHKEFDLPTVEGDNICEGFVIEPVVPAFFPNGSRIILKNKNEAFCEKASHKKPRKVQLPHEWTDEGTAEVEEILLYVTENRLRNVLSHMGEVTDKMFGKIMGLFAQDVFKSYLKDRNTEFSALDKKEQDLVKKEMQRGCADCIRPNFRDIMDGEY